MVTTQKKIKALYLGSMTGFKGEDKDLINCLDPYNFFDTGIYTNDPREVKELDLTETHRRIKCNDSEYMIFNNNDTTKVYKIVPLIENDDTFVWSKQKYGYIAKVKTGSNIRFCVIRYSDAKIRINVYCGLKSMYGQLFYNENGIDNKMIKKLIKQMKEELINEFVAA